MTAGSMGGRFWPGTNPPTGSCGVSSGVGVCAGLQEQSIAVKKIAANQRYITRISLPCSLSDAATVKAGLNGKMLGENCRFPDEGRVPHISLVFREMWDSNATSL